jgi:hypothetical protein
MKDVSKTGIEIPWEVADGITLATLKDQLKMLEKSLRQYEKGKSWLHPDDVIDYRDNLIPALKSIIDYFGG